MAPEDPAENPQETDAKAPTAPQRKEFMPHPRLREIGDEFAQSLVDSLKDHHEEKQKEE